ncbi:unnamed protein product [Ceutorhynchus assimilis]|uniref:Uncharacterized protein n=1 Tax=Ceutorhynchus assimilis TaxID=467358 RepID=A0A9P0DJL2_9CUCU|nr:unnamed protein product [Ceutorhynchus assimilis]
MFLIIIFILTAWLFTLKIYLLFKSKTCLNNVSLIGKTVVVTGANTGIGYCAALDFAKRGARVILACRDREKAEIARTEIVRQTENVNVEVKIVDFARLCSVRERAKDILENEDRLDVLVNNAGAAALLDKVTEDGFQNVMQINYFGPVLFTLLLLDLMMKSPKARIINVASVLAKIGKIDPSNLNQYARSLGTYSNSKLGNILFTMMLAEKLKATSISVFSLHPGVIRTKIFRRLTMQNWSKTLFNFAAYFTFKTPLQGSQTIIFTATEQNIENLSGRHFEECGVVTSYTSATNRKLAEDLWDETLKLLKINENKLFIDGVN